MERTNGGLTVAEPENGTALSVPQMQKAALTNASALAQDVAKIVRDNGLSKRFGSSPKEHVFVEGWLTISRVNNEAPHSKIEAVETHGEYEVIKARAWITDASGAVVSEADGYCSNEEGNWKGKPFYARASMAQTRAIGKAMRLRHAWVMVMAGFSPTPAEEMDGVHDEPKPTPGPVNKEYKLKPVASKEGDDAEKVPASVTDAAAPDAKKTEEAPELFKVLAVGKPKSSGSSTRYGIMLHMVDDARTEDPHKPGCAKIKDKNAYCDCGTVFFRDTFSTTVVEEARKAKGKLAFVWSSKNGDFINIDKLEVYGG